MPATKILCLALCVLLVSGGAVARVLPIATRKQHARMPVHGLGQRLPTD
jgi:hypothetical protein